MSLNNRVKLTLQSLVQRIDTDVGSNFYNDEIVLLQQNDESLYHLNHTGTDLWTWLEAPKKVDELTVLLAEKYQGKAEQYQKDVLDWLRDAEIKQLIKIIN